MGLLNKLTTEGSNLSKYDGAQPPVNPLATKQSKLHADGNQPGYSLNGNNASTVINDYGNYEDGVNNAIPQPSTLDLNGQMPTITPRGQKLPYLKNLPG
jgi:hypothetical protein